MTSEPVDRRSSHDPARARTESEVDPSDRPRQFGLRFPESLATSSDLGRALNAGLTSGLSRRSLLGAMVIGGAAACSSSGGGDGDAADTDSGATSSDGDGSDTDSQSSEEVAVDDTTTTTSSTTTTTVADGSETIRPEIVVNPGPQVIDVASFGAVGDGVTDDTAAIQAAIDSLGDDSAWRAGTIHLSGSHLISAPIRLFRRNVALIGDGWGDRGAGGSALLWADNGGAQPMVIVDECVGVHIFGIRFQGNDTPGSVPTAAIEFVQTPSATISNQHHVVERCFIGRWQFDANRGGFVDGIAWRGVNRNNDQCVVAATEIFGCSGAGVVIENSQYVLHHIRDSWIHACTVGLRTSADCSITNVYMTDNGEVDLVAENDAWISARQFSSESGRQLARLRSHAQLHIDGGYWALSEDSIAQEPGVVVVIDAEDPAPQEVIIRNYEIRRFGGFDGSLRPIFRVRPETGRSPAYQSVHPHTLKLFDVQGVGPDNLDVDLQAADDERLIEGAIGTIAFRNHLKGDRTVDLSRYDLDSVFAAGGLILESPGGARFRLQVSDDGELSTESL